MPFNEPVPTYAVVSEQSTDPKTGKTKNQFSPAWLAWFLSLAKSVGIIDLNSQVTGVLDTAHGGTATDISTYFTGTIPLAKLTALGTDGSIQVVNGLIFSTTDPT